jgi:hypothetical protein
VYIGFTGNKFLKKLSGKKRDTLINANQLFCLHEMLGRNRWEASDTMPLKKAEQTLTLSNRTL